MTRFLSAAGGMLLALATVCAWAQDNAIESISARSLAERPLLANAMARATVRPSSTVSQSIRISATRRAREATPAFAATSRLACTR